MDLLSTCLLRIFGHFVYQDALRVWCYAQFNPVGSLEARLLTGMERIPGMKVRNGWLPWTCGKENGWLPWTCGKDKLIVPSQWYC